MINFLSFLLEAAVRGVPGTFEVTSATTTSGPSSNTTPTIKYDLTRHAYRYKLTDGNEARGEVVIEGNSGHNAIPEADLSMNNKGTFDPAGNPMAPESKQWQQHHSQTGHGMHHEIARVTAEAIRAHIAACPYVSAINGISIDTTGEDWSGYTEPGSNKFAEKKAEQKFKWRVSSLRQHLEPHGFTVKTNREQQYGSTTSREYTIYPPGPK